MASSDKENAKDSAAAKDSATLRAKMTAAWDDLEKRVEAGVQKAASRALAPLLQQVTDLRSRVEKLATKMEDVARTRLGLGSKDKDAPASKDKDASGKDKDSRS